MFLAVLFILAMGQCEHAPKVKEPQYPNKPTELIHSKQKPTDSYPGEWSYIGGDWWMRETE